MKKKLKRVNTLNKILIFLIIPVFFFSCKSGNILIKKERKKGELRNIADARLIKLTENNNLDFNTLFFKKFQAEVSFNDQSKTFKGNLFIKRDTSIIISILPLMGIELYRVKLVPDTVYILDRTKKKITVVDYNYFWDKFFIDIDFATIQNILLDQFFCYPASDDDKNCIKKFKHYIRNDEYSLQSLKNGRYTRISKKNNVKDIMYHEFLIAPDIYRITGSYIEDFSSDTRLKITYGEFIELEDYVFPSEFSIRGNRNSNKFYINIVYNNIELNGISKISFRYSDKYKIEYLKK